MARKERMAGLLSAILLAGCGSSGTTTDDDNNPPVIEGSPDASVIMDESYRFIPAASDPDGDALTFSIANQPVWSSFDNTTGQLSGVPGADHVGLYRDIVISVSDGTNRASLPAFTLSVTDNNGHTGNAPPIISGTPATRAVVNVDYHFTPNASDPDGDPLSFSIANQPAWSSFDNASGQLSGNPGASDTGLYQDIVISVSDGLAQVSLPAFALSVTENSGNTPPVIEGTPAANAVVDENYSFTPNASDADGDTLIFSIANQPAWSNFDNTTGGLSGVPGIDDVGVYENITISVSDGADQASLPALTISVTENHNNPPTIGGSPTTRINVNDSYSFAPSASDEDDDPLTFSITNQPSWSSFDETSGRLSGVPGSGDEGVYQDIVISVSDGTERISLTAFTITVLSSAHDGMQNYPGIPLLDQLLTQDPDGKGSDWQANPEPWPDDPRTAPTPDWPAGWPLTPVTGHWYIDNTDPNATDSDMGDNAIDGVVYGTPDRPRATLMGNRDFAPGAYVEIQGGPYNSGFRVWRFQCTETDPCWITSDATDKALLAGSVRLVLEGSSWLTVENLLWDPEAPGAETNINNNAISMIHDGTRGDTHHVTLRHIDFRRWSYISGGGGIINVSSSNLQGGRQTHHILIYGISAIEAGNSVARGCDWSVDDCDNHLVGITTRVQGGVTSNRTHHIWVLDTHSDRISGNQVQAISLGGAVNIDWRETVHHIYLGGNVHSNSRQSGWGAKRSSNFIVSSCRSWGNRSWTGGNGQSASMQYGPDWVWFINNDFSDSDFGVQQTSTNEEATPADNGKLFVLGNLFYNIRRFSVPTKTDRWRGGFGVAAWANNAKHYIAFNTCVACESGLAVKVHAVNNQDEGAYIWNNVVHSIDDTVGTFVSYDPGSFVWVHNNLFWDNGNFRANWVNLKTSLADWQNADAAHVYDNTEGNPLLSNTLITHPERDYSLGSGSPALGAGATTAADGTDPFAVFLERYGMDIARDVVGNIRTLPYSAGAYQ